MEGSALAAIAADGMRMLADMGTPLSSKPVKDPTGFSVPGPACCEKNKKPQRTVQNQR
jgi:hypothetical protein